MLEIHDSYQVFAPKYPKKHQNTPSPYNAIPTMTVDPVTIGFVRTAKINLGAARARHFSWGDPSTEATNMCDKKIPSRTLHTPPWIFPD